MQGIYGGRKLKVGWERMGLCSGWLWEGLWRMGGYIEDTLYEILEKLPQVFKEL